MADTATQRRTLREEALNIPNLLTFGRVLVIPWILMLLYKGSPSDSYWAALLYTLAAITDFVDGYIARRWNMSSVLGKFLDPLADKLLVMALLVLMIPLGRVPAWLTIVILGREMTITGLRSVASAEGMVIPASRGGKWKTALQMIGLVALIIHYPYNLNFLLFEMRVNFHAVGFWLMVISLAPSLLSAADYLIRFALASGQRRAARQAQDMA